MALALDAVVAMHFQPGGLSEREREHNKWMYDHYLQGDPKDVYS